MQVSLVVPTVIEWRAPRKVDTINELGVTANIELLLFPFGSTKIKFLSGFAGDLHDISLRTSKLIDKSFVYNSVPYIWEIRSGFTRRQYTLYKCVGRDRIEVGQFEQASDRLNGVLLLNASEIKVEVGILTFVVVLKEK